MRPRDLIPIQVEAELTPMGRRPFNRWIQSGAGGGPYEPRGWFQSSHGNRLAPGYDGIDDGLRTAEGLFSMPLSVFHPGEEITPPTEPSETPTEPPPTQQTQFSIDPIPAVAVIVSVAAGIGLAFYLARG